MNKLTFLLSVLGMAAVSVSATNADLLNLGTQAGNFLLGTCLAMQEDTTDTTTDCYTSCLTSSAAVQNMFNIT